METEPTPKQSIFDNPLLLSVVGGILTLLTSIILQYAEKKSALELEEKRFQTELLLKAAEKSSYQEFSQTLLTFQEAGILTLDSQVIRNLKKSKFISTEEKLLASNSNSGGMMSGNPMYQQEPGTMQETYYILIPGGENISEAQALKSKLITLYTGNCEIWSKNNLFYLAAGPYSNASDALPDQFEIKDRFSATATIKSASQFCFTLQTDPITKVKNCIN